MKVLLALLLVTLLTSPLYGQRRPSVQVCGVSMLASTFYAVTPDNICQRSQFSKELAKPAVFSRKFERLIQKQAVSPGYPEYAHNIRMLYQVVKPGEDYEIVIPLRFKFIEYKKVAYRPSKKLVALLQATVPDSLLEHYQPARHLFTRDK